MDEQSGGELIKFKVKAATRWLPLHEIEWEAPLIEPYRDPDAEALMRKKYGFVMDSVAF